MSDTTHEFSRAKEAFAVSGLLPEMWDVFWLGWCASLHERRTVQPRPKGLPAIDRMSADQLRGEVMRLELCEHERTSICGRHIECAKCGEVLSPTPEPQA